MHSKPLLLKIRLDHIYYDTTVLLTLQEKKKYFLVNRWAEFSWTEFGTTVTATPWFQYLARNKTILATSVPTNILQTVKFWPISLMLPQFSFLSLGATKMTLLQSPLHTTFPSAAVHSPAPLQDSDFTWQYLLTLGWLLLQKLRAISFPFKSLWYITENYSVTLLHPKAKQHIHCCIFRVQTKPKAEV